MAQTLRVLMAKAGLDGHDLGVRLVASNLRDAGMEIIYTGRHLTPAQIVAAAIQEDVEVIGLSILSGAHLTLVRELMEEMQRRKVSDMEVVMGGTIPRKDVALLKGMGVREIFGIGSSMEAIVAHFKSYLQSQ